MNKKCPICYGEDTYLKNQRMSLHQCNTCDHTFTVIDRVEEETYEEDYYLKAHKNWFANPDFKLFENVYNTAKCILGKEKIRLADVGCGQGAFLKHLQSKFKADAPELNGIDIIKNEHPGIKFESGDFLEMKFDVGYNIITSFMVIEHVIDPHLFINKMVESIPNNGVIVVNTINNGSLIYRVARFLNNLGFPTSHDRLYNHHHLQHYTNKSLKTLLEMEGVEVVKIENHNYQLKAVDVPNGSAFMMSFYKLMVAGMFAVSSVLNLGHHQTLYCKKK
ncbi:MAG: class I SAM-dependent methyltransferase [Vicingaceae bacterium]|nr:class I SAM-dependent methyltransferase [Vicingaceae bacterium]